MINAKTSKARVAIRRTAWSVVEGLLATITHSESPAAFLEQTLAWNVVKFGSPVAVIVANVSVEQFDKLYI